MKSRENRLKLRRTCSEKKYDSQFQIVFEALRQILEGEEKPEKKIGFIVKETKAVYKTKRKG